MTQMRAIAGVAAVAFGLSGCATLRENRTACLVVTTVSGAALGGLGGGLGVDRVEHEPVTNGERAAGAGAGAAGGALLGMIAGQFLCPEQAKAAPPPPPPPAAPTRRKIETLNGPNFDFDKATLRPEGKQRVDHAVTIMQENRDMHVTVEGHTDSIGSDKYNQRLSERRADAVRDYMIQKGIAGSRIKARGFGKSRPVASNETADGRAQNRRVEIIAE